MGRGGKREGDNRAFVEKLSRPKVPSQQLTLCTAVQDTGQCFCVIGGGAVPSVNEFLSHSINHGGGTERVMTLFVTSAALKCLPSAGPGFAFCHSLSASVSHSVTHTVTYLVIPLSFLVALLYLTVQLFGAALMAYRGNQFICCKVILRCALMKGQPLYSSMNTKM